MFSTFKYEQTYELNLETFSSQNYSFLEFNDFGPIPQLREEKIIGDVNERDFNNEIKKNNLQRNQYLEENTRFSSKRPSTQFIEGNSNISKIINNNLLNDKINIIQINDMQNENKGKKLLGRKCKNSDEIGQHNKFSDDNLSRRAKHILLNYIYIFINNLIVKVYNNNNNNLNEKNNFQLLKTDYKQVIKNKVDYNLNFLNKKLKDIFSDNVSTKYRKYSLQYNKKIIEQLLNEKDEAKKNLFEKIFNLTFFDCLKYFRGEIEIEELEGLVKLDEACEKFKKEKDYENYIPIFKTFIFNFEKIIKNKKVRNKGKKIRFNI